VVKSIFRPAVYRAAVGVPEDLNTEDASEYIKTAYDALKNPDGSFKNWNDPDGLSSFYLNLSDLPDIRSSIRDWINTFLKSHSLFQNNNNRELYDKIKTRLASYLRSGNFKDVSDAYYVFNNTIYDIYQEERNQLLGSYASLVKEAKAQLNNPELSESAKTALNSFIIRMDSNKMKDLISKAQEVIESKLNDIGLKQEINRLSKNISESIKSTFGIIADPADIVNEIKTEIIPNLDNNPNNIQNQINELLSTTAVSDDSRIMRVIGSLTELIQKQNAITSQIEMADPLINAMANGIEALGPSMEDISNRDLIKQIGKIKLILEGKEDIAAKTDNIKQQVSNELASYKQQIASEIINTFGEQGKLPSIKSAESMSARGIGKNWNKFKLSLMLPDTIGYALTGWITNSKLVELIHNVYESLSKQSDLYNNMQKRLFAVMDQTGINSKGNDDLIKEVEIVVYENEKPVKVSLKMDTILRLYSMSKNILSYENLSNNGITADTINQINELLSKPENQKYKQYADSVIALMKDSLKQSSDSYFNRFGISLNPTISSFDYFDINSGNPYSSLAADDARRVSEAVLSLANLSGVGRKQEEQLPFDFENLSFSKQIEKCFNSASRYMLYGDTSFLSNVLDDKDVSEAMEQRYPGSKEALTNWLNEITGKLNADNSVFATIIQWMRSNIAKYTLHFNPTTVLNQLPSWFNGITKIVQDGNFEPAVLTSLWYGIKHPIALHDEIANLSSYMRTRMAHATGADLTSVDYGLRDFNSFFTDAMKKDYYEDQLKMLNDYYKGNIPSKVKQGLLAFWNMDNTRLYKSIQWLGAGMMRYTDMAVADSVWNVAYLSSLRKSEKSAILESGKKVVSRDWLTDKVQADAIKYADSVIRDTQSITDMRIMPALYRSKGIARLFTLFRGPLSQSTNLIYNTVGKMTSEVRANQMRIEGKEPSLDLAGNIFGLTSYIVAQGTLFTLIENYGVPAFAYNLFLSAFGSGDDDDKKKETESLPYRWRASRFVSNMTGQLWGSIPILGDVASGVLEYGAETYLDAPRGISSTNQSKTSSGVIKDIIDRALKVPAFRPLQSVSTSVSSLKTTDIATTVALLKGLPIGAMVRAWKNYDSGLLDATHDPRLLFTSAYMLNLNDLYPASSTIGTPLFGLDILLRDYYREHPDDINNRITKLNDGQRLVIDDTGKYVYLTGAEQKQYKETAIQDFEAAMTGLGMSPLLDPHEVPNWSLSKENVDAIVKAWTRSKAHAMSQIKQDVIFHILNNEER